jgi:Carboxypeptidase regulatory-like domain/TonB dependent receptor
VDASLVECVVLLRRDAKKLMQVLAATMALLCVCVPAFSQASQGTIQGGVFDKTGGAVAGASVSVIDVARGLTRSLTTDSAGEYVANDLNPGTYTVRAESKGFQTVEHSGVLVEVGQNIRVDLVVQPGEQTQTITVTAEIPTTNTTDATLGGAVSNDAINQLPLNGRDFDNLLQLRPGVILIVGGGTGQGFSTNGRGTFNDALRVEGIIGIPQAQGSDIMNGTFRTGDKDSILPIDAIQEFNTQESPKAEDGYRDGAIVYVGVKSGTNSIHGTAYAFGRDGAATDASNYFSGKVTPATLEQFGATAGGPIVKDKLFWFLGFEGLRLAVADLNNDTIPADVSMTSATSSGCLVLTGVNCGFSMVNACNDLNAKGLVSSPLSAQISGLNTATCTVTPSSSSVENLWPYTTNTSTTGNYVPPITNSGPLNNGLFKGDYAISQHHHLSGMYFVAKSAQVQAEFPGELTIPWETPFLNDVQQYGGSWTWTPNSTWVNQFRLGYVYLHDIAPQGDQSVVASNPWPTGYGMNTGVTNPLYGGMPQIQITSFTGYLGTGNESSIRGPEGDVDLVESVSYLHGSHSFRFGFEYLDAILDQDPYHSAQGDVVFPSLEGFLTGSATSGTILLGDPTVQARSHWYSAYAQDDWRLKPRLTLNLGLRYEYASSPVERNNYEGNFNPNVTGNTPAVEETGPGAPLSSIYTPQRLDFRPRVGLAWDIQGNGKTVLRAGVGAFGNFTNMLALLGTVPFGANFPSLGVNNSGTAINAHTPVTPVLTCTNANQCNNAATSIPGELNWNLAGPIFPSTAAQTIGGVVYSGITCTAAAPCPVPAVNPNFLDPYSVQWNVTLQRAITNNLVLNVAYVGNHGADQTQTINLNQPPIDTGWAGTPTTNCLNSASTNYNNCKASTPQEVAAWQYGSQFPYLNSIKFLTNGEISDYNALQATLQARNYHGLSFLAGFTYAHALDWTGDKFNPRLTHENSASDLRDRFTFSPSYDIPGIKSPGQMLQGWTLSGIVVLQSGLPWTPSDSSVDWLGEGANTIGAAWNYSGPPSAFTVTATPIPCYGKFSGCTPYPVVGGLAQLPAACVSAATAPYGGPATTNGQLALAALTNTGCYVRGLGVLTPPAYGTLGDARGGIFRGQNYYNTDFSVAKVWKFRERYSAQFRAEFFNFFNRADFAGSSQGGTAVVAASASGGVGGGFGYGTVTPDAGNAVLGTGGPRHIQFGLKLTF